MSATSSRAAARQHRRPISGAHDAFKSTGLYARVVLKEIYHRVVITLVLQGKVNPELFITARIRLDDVITEGFDVLINRRDTGSRFSFNRSE